VNILVTGGAGFIGSHLCDRLLLDHTVVGLDDLSSGGNLNSRVKFYKGGTYNKTLVDRIFRDRFDLVFHLAANTNVPKSVEDPLFDFKTLEGSLNVIDQCFKMGVPIIYISSSFVYGNALRPTKETEPFKVSAPYGITKYTVENYLEFYRGKGLYSTIVRPATVYGPRQTGGAMADYIRKLKEGKQAIIYGSKTRDYLYVSDLIDALILLMNLPKDFFREYIYNVGTGVETSIMDLYFKLGMILDKLVNPTYEIGRIGEVEQQRLNSDRIRQLGWEPKVGLEEGLKLTV
jgi:UDP-glucose 4-epimerase